MHATIYIFRSVVNHLMRVIASKPIVGEQCVSVQRGSSFHVLFHFRLQNWLATGTDNHSANFTAALKNAHNWGFVLSASSGDPSLSLAQVHIPRFAADESFVRFNFAAVAT